ncbi:hypothetical protein Q644_20805 [Brucella intermedia 229E]|uniref:Uncharacterized protein n=1 Tax=Brucella intermedia 229E TaxID=1337887 RepID=U4VFH7_9HYPH|nr:hypothetical protein Q644_20805 [Brucella intermedia 229E]
MVILLYYNVKHLFRFLIILLLNDDYLRRVFDGTQSGIIKNQ